MQRQRKGATDGARGGSGEKSGSKGKRRVQTAGTPGGAGTGARTACFGTGEGPSPSPQVLRAGNPQGPEKAPALAALG